MNATQLLLSIQKIEASITKSIEMETLSEETTEETEIKSLETKSATRKFKIPYA